mmetsp:Transcript_83809/g.233775  ORF Transcript_83809/g.233775 Transcript_83809/m.233775 type:complete len:319 (-) Transcript_83809:67-1023(-)
MARFAISSVDVALVFVPDPGSAAPARALCHAVLGEAVRRTKVRLLVQLLGCGALPAWRHRNETVALYTEAYNLAFAADCPALDVVIFPPAASPAQPWRHPKLRAALGKVEATFGLEAHRAAAEEVIAVAPVETCPFVPFDTERAVAPFLVADFITYEDETEMLPTFERVVVGGTFDNFHAGHKRLLTAAAVVCSGILTIGIMSDAYLSRQPKQLADMIESIDTRVARVREFLSLTKPDLAIETVPIDDAAGPTTKRCELQAIVASSETLEGCRSINTVRVRQGWDPLSIVVIARTDESTLSSSAIRRWRRARLAESKL